MQRVTCCICTVGFCWCPWARTPQDQWLGKATAHCPSGTTLKHCQGVPGAEGEEQGAVSTGQLCPPIPGFHSVMQRGEDAPPKAKHQEHGKGQEKGSHCPLTCAQLRFLLVKW